MNLVHYLSVLLLLIQLGLYSLSDTVDPNIQNVLKQISNDDKESLEAFFRHLVENESLGYVIFGNKPMILCGLYSKPIYIDKKNSKIFAYNFLWQHYRTWKKYQHLFLLRNYIIRTIKSSIDKFQYDLIVINKKQFIKIIQKHIQLFQKKLGTTITAENILLQIELDGVIIDNILKDHEDLLGVLLGFGKHNSLLFQKKQNLDIQGKYSPPYDINKVDKIYQLDLTGFPEKDYPFTFIQLPCFVEDKNHPESNQIKMQYINTQKRLCKIYSSGHFLKITLEELLK